MCWLALFLFLSVSTRDKRDEINIFVAGDPCRKEYPMLKVFATQVVISRGYDGAAAIKFSEKGDAVRFRIGKKVYDPNAENNARWVNLAVKGFGPICERIKKMQLKDGSFVNLIGRLDEDVWEDQQTHEKKSAMVIILDDMLDLKRDFCEELGIVIQIPLRCLFRSEFPNRSCCRRNLSSKPDASAAAFDEETLSSSEYIVFSQIVVLQ